MALDDVLRNFDKVIGRLEKKSEKVVYEIAADLLKESSQLVPFKDGDLRKSGKVTMVRRGRKPIARVSYGDGRVTYALIRHEIKAKNYSEPGTGWKYLERPLKQNTNKYKKYIRNKLGEELWKETQQKYY